MRKMRICTRFITVKGVTKILQMDKLLPRGLHESLTTTTTIPRSSSSAALPSAAFACFSIPPPSSSSFCPPSKTPYFYHSCSKYHDSFFVLFTMEKNSLGTEEGKKDQQKEGSGASSDYSDRGADDILPHLLNIYGSCASPQDFEIYAPNATFEDPLMRAEGIKQIKSAFYSLTKLSPVKKMQSFSKEHNRCSKEFIIHVFSESRIVEYNVNENVISHGKKEINIDNKQYYKFLGKDIHMISLIKLQMENGRIVRHEDWWDKKPLWNRETVKPPLIGRMTEMTRRASMLATHALMGFGKDPTK